MLTRYRQDLPAIRQGILTKLGKIRDQITTIGDIEALNDINLRVCPREEEGRGGGGERRRKGEEERGREGRREVRRGGGQYTNELLGLSSSSLFYVLPEDAGAIGGNAQHNTTSEVWKEIERDRRAV